MGQFSVEKPVTPGSALSGNQQAWESQAEVDTVLSETGATMDSLPRWRREGLLSREIDWKPQTYHGSVVRYPKGTCAQIRAITTLFKQKKRVDYVGLRLWRLGLPVEEKHWASATDTARAHC